MPLKLSGLSLNDILVPTLCTHQYTSAATRAQRRTAVHEPTTLPAAEPGGVPDWSLRNVHLSSCVSFAVRCSSDGEIQQKHDLYTYIISLHSAVG